LDAAPCYRSVMAPELDDPHANAQIFHAGASLDTATAACILVHGRGAGADDVLSLAELFGLSGIAYLAPEAPTRVWYPVSFLEPVERNEPWLASALNVVESVFKTIEAAGIPRSRTALGGFSQGACLSLEFAVRNPRRYGAVLALSGGVIGQSGALWNANGSMEATPVFLGCSDVDPFIPLARVKESTELVKRLGAEPTERIYSGMAHTVNEDEVSFCRQLLGAM
jgi:predicted esterase